MTGSLGGVGWFVGPACFMVCACLEAEGGGCKWVGGATSWRPLEDVLDLMQGVFRHLVRFLMKSTYFLILQIYLLFRSLNWKILPIRRAMASGSSFKLSEVSSSGPGIGKSRNG